MGDPILDEVRHNFPDLEQRRLVLEIIEDIMVMQRLYRRFLCVVFFALGVVSVKAVEWMFP